MKFIIKNLLINIVICTLCAGVSVGILLTPTSSQLSDTLDVMGVFIVAYVCGWVARGYFDRQNPNLRSK